MGSADLRLVDEQVQAPSDAPGAPRVLGGRFEVIDELGRGAAGSIYRVVDRERSGEQVALKLLRNTDAFDENTLQRFLEEIRVCQSIRHANIVEAYEYVQLSDGIGFTMELVHGQDLSRIVKQRVIGYEEIDQIFIQLLAGLGELHRCGIITSVHSG